MNNREKQRKKKKFSVKKDGEYQTRRKERENRNRWQSTSQNKDSLKRPFQRKEGTERKEKGAELTKVKKGDKEGKDSRMREYIGANQIKTHHPHTHERLVSNDRFHGVYRIMICLISRQTKSSNCKGGAIRPSILHLLHSCSFSDRHSFICVLVLACLLSGVILILTTLTEMTHA